jgi:hypothetical protein
MLEERDVGQDGSSKHFMRRITIDKSLERLDWVRKQDGMNPENIITWNSEAGEKGSGLSEYTDKLRLIAEGMDFEPHFQILASIEENTSNALQEVNQFLIEDFP